MIPRTVTMAKSVASIFNATELNDYGNIILNGYATTGPNTINQKAWQYPETTTAPVNLPSLTSYRPALKGWSTNSLGYYTRTGSGNYFVEPGTPTPSEYTVHSFTIASGEITGLTSGNPGEYYVAGSYPAEPAIGGSGAGALLDITVDGSGSVTSAVIASPGDGYVPGDVLTALIPGGRGFYVRVASINVTQVPGIGLWAQSPVRLSPPGAIRCSFIAPRVDNLVAPPIDYVTP